ncbi:DUF4124 domain-containing protein [Dyella psychrodurans]|uniref:DUF4124 domain-containing protein n=1 Tax=Dyella psychrodurans TaxID=1927960 RepID=A0A370X2D4_9GAMM|nr:DUF4124 domain-containing protein [Dyella psychrodurans]RDS82450.1 DUF4124 domain-containing protein [Dyella psychrodurans]
MRRLSIALALLLVAPLVSAQVYKWTDAHGTTHYSESPPPTGTKYSQVTVTGSEEPISSGSSSAPASATPTSSSSQDGNNSQPMADTPENRAKMCASLKTNIGTLQGSGPVVMQNGGQTQVLNADQRKQQLDASQSQYQQYCGS